LQKTHAMKLIFSLLLFSNLTVNAQTWQWANQLISNHSLGKTCSDMDASGNIYVAGIFSDTIYIGTSMLVSSSAQSVYQAKYNAGGTLIYARTIAFDSLITVTDIKARTGGCIITGQFTSTGYFGSNNYPVLSNGDYDVFVASYDDNGLVWVTNIGEAGYDYAAASGFDQSGNVYVAGDFHLSSYPFSGSKIFIAKYDSMGNSLWKQEALSYYTTDLTEDISTDVNGTSFITGQFFNTLTFDSVSFLYAGNVEANIFILKVDPSGTIEWMQKAGASSGYCSGLAVSGGSSGDCYLTGVFHGTIYFDSLSLTGSFGIANQSFFARINSTGNFLYATKTDGKAQGRNIISTPAGFIASGYFTDSIHAGTNSLVNSASQAIYIVTGDNQCNIVSGQRVGGLHNILFGNLSVNGGDMALSGTFQDSLNLGINNLVSSAGKYDGFVTAITSSNSTGETLNTDVVVMLKGNDANLFLQINTPSAEKFSVKVYDASGRIIRNLMNDFLLPGEHSIQIPLQSLAAGCYFLNVVSPDCDKTFKFMSE
jgi:hypothetical protein